MRSMAIIESGSRVNRYLSVGLSGSLWTSWLPQVWGSAPASSSVTGDLLPCKHHADVESMACTVQNSCLGLWLAAMPLQDLMTLFEQSAIVAVKISTVLLLAHYFSGYDSNLAECLAAIGS